MFKCPVCGCQCQSRDLLQEHILRVHRKQPVASIQYQCTSCGKSWVNHSTFRKHQQFCVGIVVAQPVQQQHHETPGPSSSGNSSVDVDPDSSGGDGSEFMRKEDQVDAGDDRDLEISPEELLQQEVADFLVHIKEDCNATQTIIDALILRIKKIQMKFIDVIVKQVQERSGFEDFVKVADVLEILEDVKDMNLFEGVDTAENIIDYLHESEGLVKPQKVVVKQQKEVCNGKIVTKDVDFFHIVPFLDQLRRLLQCKDVLKCVNNPRATEANIFHSVLDGSMYQENEVVLANKGKPVLSVLFYHDGVDVVDSASARSGKHSMTFFYWILGNIFPELRSADRVVQLYAVVKTATLKQYGYGPILENFIEGINKLREGVVLELSGEEKQFYGILQSSCADYPANAAIGGFKESVSAEKPCGSCLASNSQNYFQISNIEEFQQRTKDMHQAHLNELINFNNMSSREKAALQYDPSIKYGVNRRSELMDIPYFDVTKALTPDLMHIIHEGLLEFVCRLVLKHVVKDEAALTVPEINERILQCSKSFSRDRPGMIFDEHLGPKKKLRQSAAQMRVLALILPFVVGKKMGDGQVCFPGNTDYLECLLSLNRILNLSLSYEFHASDVPRLKKMIQDFHVQMLRISPDISLAKLHFLHHLPDQILLQGGIRQVSNFRFEGHHGGFKRLMRITRNFINPTMSLSFRHQAKQCQQMKDKNFLYTGHQYTVKRDVSTFVDRNLARVRMAFPDSTNIQELTRLTMHGTLFKESSLILLSETQSPEFGLLKKIYLLDKKNFVFICQKLNTVSIAADMNAFELTLSPASVTVNVKNLIHPHETVDLKWYGKWYALLLGHRTLLS